MWTVTSTVALFFALLALATRNASAQDYLTKDGQLTETLKITRLQGGFAGNTGMQFTIAPDGSWASEKVFNEKRTPKDKGKLSEKELAEVGAILKKYDLAKLPEKTGNPPGANPKTITIEFGKMKAVRIGQRPPQLDAKNPAGSIDSRFAGICKEVIGLLTKRNMEN